MHRRVEFDLHHLGVPGGSAAHLLVARAGHSSRPRIPTPPSKPPPAAPAPPRCTRSSRRPCRAVSVVCPAACSVMSSSIPLDSLSGLLPTRTIRSRSSWRIQRAGSLLSLEHDAQRPVLLAQRLPILLDGHDAAPGPQVGAQLRERVHHRIAVPCLRQHHQPQRRAAEVTTLRALPAMASTASSAGPLKTISGPSWICPRNSTWGMRRQGIERDLLSSCPIR